MNTTELPWTSNAKELDGEEGSSPCVGLGAIIYYCILLCLGLPVNILTAVALSRLAARTQKSSYWYLLALTASDILTQVFIIFAGFIVQAAILAREVPGAFAHTINVLQFTANHASIWVTVLLTMDRYVALCHPLQYRAVSYPARTQKIISAVFAISLATGIPFYWWLDVWHDNDPPTTIDKVLKWLHCFIIYFIPCSIFLVTNSMIICKLRHSGGPKRCLSKTTAILLAITTVFIILWAPRTFVMIYHLYMTSSNQVQGVHLALDIANMIAMLNTSLNFFLYCFVSKTFRRTVWEVLVSLRLPCKQSLREEIPSDPVLKPLGVLDSASL
ncbi:probable G-protein coupled receptor 142 [Hemicordylus capensis]|uniref:probable G-protein coupled receptor 142 n=1 Tax=Hemicordylus capensis TaxID=884348 RepID=UPI0023029513|nr:probable G-protein coupled receptor 142 [Hemicordylus capensis]XP_053155312.1 probable G-protein coupled receptor 142 [Hemicordylus capensis]